jgi:hypothetical protein
MEPFKTENRTRRLRAALQPAAMLAIASLSISIGVAGDKGTTFQGEIMDRQCALMHSHDNMMKAEGASNAKDCALKCVKNGDSFALFDSASNHVYVIEDSKKVQPFAGEHVQVIGSYDKDSEVLKIKSISAAK